jgi:hypothetical protein
MLGNIEDVIVLLYFRYYTVVNYIVIVLIANLESYVLAFNLRIT